MKKNLKLCEYKKVTCKFYCYDYENSVFSFQSVNNLDYDCFSKFNKSTSYKRKDFSIVYMNIRSLNANVYKIEEILISVEGLPDLICICETWLTIYETFYW